ncbi:PRKR-interacting protein 1 [Apis mellifera caucasica]|uniref:PRKR-interacting protein 1 homolog n=1 Tax=Apis mellifera TaxID=7460 RepID=A0A7M7MVC4_APIME|nr:PRKR-interacting protein 1 homolog [Apis mellifera]KAG6804005.1 PRKR-interacting protein 1 [Apis mellifera caucasica]KAG9437021.1 PRKR-interacting protein 1 [Apis mellifera carnica]|eukprot:XP_026301403.1 PRKR-interacting protein 1 homolog [Apis mellifera]
MPENKEKEEEKPVVAKTAIDLQRLKLQKLMKNPEKPIILPERPKAKSTPTVPEFVRNVMGSSAGAGSGEFHVYRHLRRKEYARQKFIQEKGHKELLDAEYHKKIEENKRIAKEITAKKRAKRLKKKQKWKQKKKIKTTNIEQHSKNENNIYSSEEENLNKQELNNKNDKIVKNILNSKDFSQSEESNSIANTNKNKINSNIEYIDINVNNSVP